MVAVLAGRCPRNVVALRHELRVGHRSRVGPAGIHWKRRVGNHSGNQVQSRYGTDANDDSRSDRVTLMTFWSGPASRLLIRRFTFRGLVSVAAGLPAAVAAGHPAPGRTLARDVLVLLAYSREAETVRPTMAALKF